MSSQAAVDERLDAGCRRRGSEVVTRAATSSRSKPSMAGDASGCTAAPSTVARAGDEVPGPPVRWAALAPSCWRSALPARCPGLWRAPGPPMEEGFMLVFPELVLQRAVPNRDFLHLYGPGSLWVLAGALQARSARSLQVERAVGFLQHLGVVVGVLAAVRPWGRWVAAAGGVAAAVDHRPADRAHRPGLGRRASPSGCGRVVTVALRPAPEPAIARLLASWSSAGLLGGVGAPLPARPRLAVGLSGARRAARPGREPRAPLATSARLAAGVAPYLVHLAMAGLGNVIDGPVRRAGLRPPRRAAAAAAAVVGLLRRLPPAGRAAHRAAVAVPAPPVAGAAHAVAAAAPRRRHRRSSSPGVGCSAARGDRAAAGAGACSPPGCSPRRSSGPTRPTSPG